jgi:ankyrin repeat protein
VHGIGATVEQQLPILHHIALHNQHPHRELSECLRLLIEAGADINAFFGVGNDELTPVRRACEATCCTQKVQILMQHGANVSLSSADGFTALHDAARFDRADCCKLLVATNSSLVHKKDVNGRTALTHAAIFGSLNAVKVLCQHGADVNTRGADALTPLMAVCSTSGHHGVAKFLIEAGTDVNVVNSSGNSAVMLAVDDNHGALVQLLLAHGADASITNNVGHRAMFKAARHGRVHIMESLAHSGVSVTADGGTGGTLLLAAVDAGHTAAAEWLIQYGADVNYSNKRGGTALHQAVKAECGDPAMVELLLANGAEVNKRAELGQTALYFAAMFGHIQCAKVLISAGADVNNSLSDGKHVLHVAVEHHHTSIAQLLLEHGATAVIDKVVKTRCLRGALCCSDELAALMMCTTADTVRALLAAGADVHVTTDAGDTCLHKAAKHKLSAPILCLLIKAGADLHAVNKRGKTAAQVAHGLGYTLIEQLLNRAAQQGH